MTNVITALFQLALVATAATIAAFMFGPYVVSPLRGRVGALRAWACPHRGDVVILKRSRYEAMLNALEALRVENAHQQDVIMRQVPVPSPLERVIGRSTPEEDRATAERADSWLKDRGVR